MSGRATCARKWTCTGCGVSISRMDGSPTPLPEFWAHSGKDDFCLVCRRQRAVEAALDSAPSDTDRDDRVKIGRASLVEFEVRRTPDRNDSAIAKACRTSAATVKATRQRMRVS